MRDLRDASIVITGPSSGIGRAAAMAFAKRGACITLAARREAVLHEAAAACEGEGGRALAVPADVGDPDGAAAGAVRDRGFRQDRRVDQQCRGRSCRRLCRNPDRGP